jgi:hypothetical protein
MNRPKQFLALIGGERIPVSAKVIATYLRVQGAVPFEFIPAPGMKVEDAEEDQPAGADWSQK